MNRLVIRTTNITLDPNGIALGKINVYISNVFKVVSQQSPPIPVSGDVYCGRQIAQLLI